MQWWKLDKVKCIVNTLQHEPNKKEMGD